MNWNKVNSIAYPGEAGDDDQYLLSALTRKNVLTKKKNISDLLAMLCTDMTNFFYDRSILLSNGMKNLHYPINKNGKEIGKINLLPSESALITLRYRNNVLKDNKNRLIGKLGGEHWILINGRLETRDFVDLIAYCPINKKAVALNDMQVANGISSEEHKIERYFDNIGVPYMRLMNMNDSKTHMVAKNLNRYFRRYFYRGF